MIVHRPLAVSAAILCAALAPPPRPSVGQPDSARAARPSARLAVLPIVFSSPDTRLALGVLPQYLFQTAGGTRPSVVRADVYYTRNRQFNVLLQPSVWLPGDRWQIAGKLRLRRWPTTFSGIAPLDAVGPEERFTEILASASAEALRRIGSRTWIGASYLLRWGELRDVDPATGALAAGAVPGSGQSRVGGFGLVATLDDREHVILPRSGALYRVHGQWHSRIAGSETAFGSMTLDLRRYFPVWGPVTAAVQGIFTASSGEVPFRVMPSLGEAVRGFETTRHIGRQRWAVQVELRAIPVWWRLGFTLFAGAGDVANRVGDFRLRDARLAFGAGLRLLAWPGDRITIRQDFAFACGAGGDYLDVNEAF